MTPEQVTAAYRRALGSVGLGEQVKVRRYTGTGGSRTSADSAELAARVIGYDLREIVGTIQQGDRKVILMAQDVADLSPSILPLTANDKILVRGRELAIVRIDDSTRRIKGTLVAYEVQVRG